MQRLLCGRKQESEVWKYFKYDSLTDRSVCIVDTEKCGRKMVGKNPTNLKGHLKTSHKEAFQAVTAAEQARSKPSHYLSPKEKTEERASRCDSSAVNAINEFTSKRTIDGMIKNPVWASDSHEAKKRDALLINMIACTGIPSRIVASESFVSFCSALDRKYKVPGEFINRNIAIIIVTQHVSMFGTLYM